MEPLSVFFIVLTALCAVITVITFVVSFKHQLGLALFGNYKFWVLLLYIVATLLTALREVVLRTVDADTFNPMYFTVMYNWAATIIVHLNSLFPFQLYRAGYKKKNKGKETHRHAKHQVKRRFFKVIAVVLLWTVLLIVTAVLHFAASVNLELLIGVWRSVFSVNALLEMFLLVHCLKHFHSTSMEASYRLYVMVTVWMRAGILVANGLRYSSIEARTVGVIHMCFVFSGLLVYNAKYSRKAMKVYAKTTFGSRVSTAMPMGASQAPSHVAPPVENVVNVSHKTIKSCKEGE